MKREKRKEKKERKNILILCVLCVLCVKISGCVSLVENIGKGLDGSGEKIISKYKSENDMEIQQVRNRKKEESILITFKNYPMIKLRASLPEENGLIYITSLEYFGSSINGWNEFSMAMIGSSSLFLDKEENPKLEKINELEYVQITNGRIHRYDTRITGNEALTALRNRYERILAITEWMSKYPEKEENNFLSIEQFNNYWMPILLPEMLPKGKRPENWFNKDDKFQKGEDINWNIGYSERIMPEELRPIRDSGTLLRDWEEALPWIYMDYYWENIVELLSKENYLTKIK